MAIAQNIMDSLHDKGAFFNITEEDIFTQSGAHIPGKVALVNSDNNVAVGIVSNKYKLLRNEEAMHDVLTALDLADVSLDGASAEYSTTPDFARSIMTVQLPAYAVDMGRGDSTIMEIVVRNSYDGKWIFGAEAGGFRIKCLNGQILGSIAGSYKARHKSALDSRIGAHQMVSAVTDFQGSGQWWENLRSRPVEDAEIIDTFHKFRTQKAAPFEGTSDEFYDNKINTKLLEKFGVYQDEMGKTSFALYNTLTDYATHTPKGAQGQNRERIRAAYAIHNSAALAMA